MSLADMIAQANKEQIAILDKPSQIVAAGKERREVSALREASLKQSEASTKATEAQTRLTEQRTGQEAQTFPVELETKKKALDTVDLKMRQERQAASRGVPEQTVDQILEWNKLYVGGNVDAKTQRDVLIKSIAEDPNLKALLAYHPAYAGIAQLDTADLFDPDLSPQELETNIQTMVTGLEQNMGVLKGIEARRAQEAAASRLELSRGFEKQKSYEQTAGELQAQREAGIDPNAKEPSAGDLTNERQALGGDIITSLTSVGIDLKDLAISKDSFANMDHDVFTGEKRIWEAARRSITDGPTTVNLMGVELLLDFSTKAKSEKSMALIRNKMGEVQKRSGVALFDASSPIAISMQKATDDYNQGFWKQNIGDKAKKSPAFKNTPAPTDS